MMRGGRSRFWFLRLNVFLVAAVVTCTFFINLCDLAYACGCQSWWSGAAVHCNIHTPQPPHCPWCTNDAFSGKLSFGLIVLAQGIISFGPGAWSVKRRLAWALLAFPALGMMTALLFGWSAGYWGQ